MKIHTLIHRYTLSVSQLREPIKFKILYLTIEKFKLIQDEKKMTIFKSIKNQYCCCCVENTNHTRPHKLISKFIHLQQQNTHRQNAYMMK